LHVDARLSHVGLGIKAGHRVLVPIGVFESRQTNFFPHAQRANSVYFRFPYQQSDSITIHPPPGAEFSSVPEVKHVLSHDFDCDIVSAVKDQNLQIDRRIGVNEFMFSVDQYTEVKAFFDLIQSGDASQAVLDLQPQSNPN